MSSIYRLEDLLPRWQERMAPLVADQTEALVEEMLRPMPTWINSADPAQQYQLEDTLRRKAEELAVTTLLPQGLDWLNQQNFGPSPAKSERVKIELLSAIRQRIPACQLFLPKPTQEIPTRSWVYSAALGAGIGCLLLTPLSLLLLGEREPGLALGGVVGAGSAVGAIGWLSRQSKFQRYAEFILAATTLTSGVVGLYRLIRRDSLGLLKTAGWFGAGWLLVTLARPRKVGLSHSESGEILQPQVRAYLNHLADLVLSLCWSHPDREDKILSSSSESNGIPESIADALGVIRQICDDPQSAEKHLSGAVRILMQRIRDQGYEWRTIPSGTLYSDDLKNLFEVFGMVEIGQPVETLNPAWVHRGQVLKAGLVRKI
ncbi:hypothetical protein KIH39_22830 [Telmatocola sphagniphila]|uniref:Uncharacterized protein n=1 Tax=Telmatocola sphagniphila TaxID=1123043 RepID=A0A8E6B570_9BACT|nr:hypothetical protein [Telmatocola sphagniphila]QVL31649.1 hypothetical protein KIH39_22830 [Telmatocola sphagniphila]